MPRLRRSQQEIDAIKKEILDTALELIVKDGFQNLSMRRLASKLGMTATTIYNYFSNKDEINLMIRMNGFEMLYRQFERDYRDHDDPLTRLRAMIRSYFSFGIQYPNYYDLMFNLNTPKYLDYVDTDLEPVARTEKEASLRNYDITRKAVAALFENQAGRSADAVLLKTVQLWCDAHGVISLFNSNFFQEIDARPSELIERLIEKVIGRIAG
jgi:AcrR family transcriptional regulator